MGDQRHGNELERFNEEVARRAKEKDEKEALDILQVGIERLLNNTVVYFKENDLKLPMSYVVDITQLVHKELRRIS